MSRWSDQFESHAIHPTLKQIGEWLNAEIKDIDADHEAERRRLTKTLLTINEVVSGADPEFFPEPLFNQLNQHLRQAPTWGNLQAYSTSPNGQYLREANDHLSQIAQVVFQLAALSRQPRAREVIKTVEEAHDAFAARIDQRESEFTTKLKSGEDQLSILEQRAATLGEEQKALGQRIDTAFSDWQTAHTEAQTKRAEDFSKAQIDRGTKFDDVIREWTTKSDTEIKDLSAKHTEKLLAAFKAYTTEADTRMADMKAKHEAILEIHGLVGTDGVAGGYQKGASDEQKSANRWRLVSMGSLALAAVWILVKYCVGFDVTPSGQINWAEVATAMSLTLVLIGASGYAARQSKLHRETEQHMRWFALEVKAIDPFLSSLPVEQQNALKNQLSQKLFGQNRLSADKAEGSVDPAAFKSISDFVLGLLKATGK